MSEIPAPRHEPARPRRPRGASVAEIAQALGAPMPEVAPSGPVGSPADERSADPGTAPIPGTETADGSAPTGTGDPAARRVTGVTLDSRTVEPGDLWSALPGQLAHGAQFAAQAARLGAVLALTDEAGRERCEAAGLPALVVADPRAATATAAALVQGRPAEHLATVGVTGTNGKTSITTAITRTLLSLDVAAGVIGTSGTSYRDVHGADHAIATVRTTPEAPELHGILARMIEDGVAVASMEVSSHALVLRRADEVVFDVACFTNLTQDHLDFHGTMEEYYRAKRLLFTPEHARRGVVCVDDEWGRRLAREATIPVTTYATLPGIEADHRAVAARAEGYGSTVTVHGPEGERTLHAALPGRHYVANTLAAELVLAAIGHSGPDVVDALGREGTVPGRMELVADAPVRGIVDYSHTADALEQALTTLRAVPGTRRLLVVMGAGGDRDRTKRPHMGEVAARLADVVIVTDDNPRSEEPASIRAEVRSGIPDSTNAQVHDVDGRGDAIALAASLADVSDTILVAGKGAETGQQIGGIVHPFDDRLRLRDALAAAATTPGRVDADDMDEGR